MSHAHSHGDMLPKGTLVIAGALMAFALTATTVVRLAHIPPAASPVLMRQAEHIQPLKSRSLRFTDRADGAVVIADVGHGGIVSVIEPGQQTGFIRGVMRGLARDRRSRGIGNQPPFDLTLYYDGELSLTDTATGRSIELTAFGSANRAAFAALLGDRGTRA